MSTAKQNCLDLATFIKSSSKRFNMHNLYPEPSINCGGCILGFALLLWDKDKRPSPRYPQELLEARLNIDHDTVQELCYTPQDQDGEKLHLTDINRDMAVATLHRFAETGVTYFDREDW